MSKLLTIDHAEGDFSDWGGQAPGEWIYGGGSWPNELAAAQAAWTIVDVPGEGYVLDYDGRGNPTDSTRPLFGPKVLLPSGETNYLYGTMRLRCIERLAAPYWVPDVALSFHDSSRTILPNTRLKNTYDPVGEYHIGARTYTDGWVVRGDNANWLTGAAGDSGTWEVVPGSNDPRITFGEWTDIHFKIQFSDIGEGGSDVTVYKVNTDSCDDTLFLDTTYAASWGGSKNPIAGVALYGQRAHVQIKHIAFTDDAGSAFAGPTCGMESLIGGFEGDEGSTIYPAPEALPHIINIQDTSGNQMLQRKLQENFESIQRQLLALDPETPNSRDPMDR